LRLLRAEVIRRGRGRPARAAALRSNASNSRSFLFFRGDEDLRTRGDFGGIWDPLEPGDSEPVHRSNNSEAKLLPGINRVKGMPRTVLTVNQ
jgi:hypothetical protein